MKSELDKSIDKSKTTEETIKKQVEIINGKDNEIKALKDGELQINEQVNSLNKKLEEQNSVIENLKQNKDNREHQVADLEQNIKVMKENYDTSLENLSNLQVTPPDIQRLVFGLQKIIHFDYGVAIIRFK